MEVRKILSAQEREKKAQRNRVIMSVILALIMLFSTAGYFVMDFTGSTKEGPKNAEYNGIKFLKDSYGYWAFSVQGYSFQTQNLPADTLNATLNTKKTLNDYSGKALYFTAEPSADNIPPNGAQEINKNLAAFIQRVNTACLSENCSGNYPIKNCSMDSVIIFKESASNLTKITDREKCAVIEYAPNQEIMAADAFLYRILGIK